MIPIDDIKDIVEYVEITLADGVQMDAGWLDTAGRVRTWLDAILPAQPAAAGDLLPCPFCGGDPIRHRDLRDGYENFKDDPDAWAHYVVCRSCASQGGWAKSVTGAARWWNMRVPRGSHLVR